MQEVVTQVCEGAVDCGVVYATDAATAGLPIMDTATGEMCSQVIYPAALLTDTAAAQDFFAYLQGQEAADLFADVGFTPLCKGSE